jgi:DNA-binding transcriptional LysR family regulator
MDQLQSMRVFRRVVERSSFAVAGRELRLSKGTVSKRIAALEEDLRTRLLNRTTRHVSPTAAGAAYYEHCVRLLDEVELVRQSLGRAAAVPMGVLRASVPLSFGLLHLTTLAPELLAAHPDLSVELSFSDRFVDLLEEQVDVAVRIAQDLPDSTSLVAQRLARAAHVLCAAPGYLQRRGTPKQPADLSKHDAVLYALSRTPGKWSFKGPRGPVQVPVNGRLLLSNSLAVRDAALAGAGVALLPSFYVSDELASGRLVALLPRFKPSALSVYAVYPKARHLTPKVRVFVEHLRDRLTRAPWALPERQAAAPSARPV